MQEKQCRMTDQGKQPCVDFCIPGCSHTSLTPQSSAIKAGEPWRQFWESTNYEISRFCIRVLGPLCCHLTDKGHPGLAVLFLPRPGVGGWGFPRRDRQAVATAHMAFWTRRSGGEPGGACPLLRGGAPTSPCPRNPVHLLCLTRPWPPEML